MNTIRRLQPANENAIQPEWMLPRLYEMINLANQAVSQLNTIAIALRNVANMFNVDTEKAQRTLDFCAECRDLLECGDLDQMIAGRDALKQRLEAGL